MYTVPYVVDTRNWTFQSDAVGEAKIQDSSLGGSSDDEDLLGVLRGPSSFANAFLYTKQPQIYPKSIVKTKTYEGVEALRQIATTSLFLQNEQKVSSNRIVPIIKEPEKLE
uniref:Uncharacterized protein n=1 Tax=Anopheles culicifacies TaxID=139723 RepID=A0A182MA75_9DIPT